MHILALNGSPAGPDSSNGRLLRALAELAPRHEWSFAPDVATLPLFTPQRLAAGRPSGVEGFAQAVSSADAVVVSTPEYAHNLPAALKSALEWLVASGELSGKPVVAVTATPAPPRGEHCMRSLVATLQAMDARVVVEAPVYGVGANIGSDLTIADRSLREELEAIIELLG